MPWEELAWCLDCEWFLAFTDGVYEALDPEERGWGLRPLMEAFSDTRDASPAKALDSILESVREHASGRPLGDDATLLIIERTGG